MKEPFCDEGQTVGDWWEMAQHVYGVRGYLVIGRREPYVIGARILRVNLRTHNDAELPQPFSIIAKTDFADWREQMEIINLPFSITAEDGFYFYRMVTD